MGKLGLIIVDYDKKYLDYLNKYLLNTYRGKIDITCFSNKELFLKEVNTIKNKDVLLINKEMYDERLEGIGISCVLTIVEGDFNLAEDRGQRIHKYKDVDRMYDIILKSYFDINPEKVTAVYSNNNTSTKIITVYSPIGGTGKSTLATALSASLSAKGRDVLYLNLEDVQSTNMYFQSDKKTTLSDFIFEVKDQSTKFTQNLINMVNRDKNTNVYYLENTENILDIEDMNENDIKWMLEKLLESGQYEYIIFDTSSKYNSIYEIILNSSNLVIAPVANSMTSVSKLNLFMSCISDAKKYYFVCNMYDRTERVIENSVVPINLMIDEDKTLRTCSGYEAICSTVIKRAVATMVQELGL
ncbi:AAA family ATPase [Inconstantimicrobium mannanitabidum]|uniref:Chromosome partitioning protein ParA n=1 Tax=Inconstantimicrobium mannanitabidum TaxID=1604901 RepID=A0ACB5RDU0_9CLOT|nr:AAA family ATPase [Clostridium sp. TW13]GKX67432.1 chromosome partitioning protein ParA [Clostridium sp. TW13]